MTDDYDTFVQNEVNRVRRHLAEMVAELQAEGGDIRAFSAAILVASVQLHAEVEGTHSLARVITKLGQGELLRDGRAGRA